MTYDALSWYLMSHLTLDAPIMKHDALSCAWLMPIQCLLRLKVLEAVAHLGFRSNP